MPTEYMLRDVTVFSDKPIHDQLKKLFDDGWALHSWQYKHNTNHQIGVMLTRNVWDQPQAEEKPTRKFLGMKGGNAV